MLLQMLVKIVLIWVFHVKYSSVNTPKNLVAVSHSRAIPSMKSSEKFVGMKHLLEVE